MKKLRKVERKKLVRWGDEQSAKRMGHRLKADVGKRRPGNEARVRGVFIDLGFRPPALRGRMGLRPGGIWDCGKERG